MKKIVVLMLCSLMATLAFGGGAQDGTGAKEEVYTLRLTTAVTADDPVTVHMQILADELEKKSNGRLKVSVFHSSQLGSTEDTQEQAKVGADIGFLSDPGRFSTIVPEMGIMAGPFLLDDIFQVNKIMETSAYKRWVKELDEKHGIVELSTNWFSGQRHFVTNQPVRTPDDLNGLRIRTMGAPIYIESINAMGGVGTAMPWSEAYQAIQQKVVDGLEAQFSAIDGSRLYEVAKYVSKTGHFHLLNGIAVGSKWFYKLPEDLQILLREEAARVGDMQVRDMVEKRKYYEQVLQENGMTIIEPDVDLFREATRKVYDKLGYKELYDEIRKEIESN
ncbi:hypothetical protein B4O97_18645 [Marispirochaeta aestuarii]|uniref:C4-dicarboxylate ABC transporter n=1 Tax=Marispirochaeta aestuarii TaxID=1963862 RepID=A0A1Y1RSY0_9SPIO|nr:C4-dicarboxylate TRAP transporter substrate-binding protein [Marispirochaeta aestuarii]ORC29902.1 hypothetical protein B4O97_18645 [Marispirochaeta aestuarii]